MNTFLLSIYLENYLIEVVVLDLGEIPWDFLVRRQIPVVILGLPKEELSCLISNPHGC